MRNPLQMHTPNYEPNISHPQTKRLLGIDTGKYIAAIGVIIIHTANGDNFRATASTNGHFGFYIDMGRFLGQICHFAVPYFFIISGYFLSKKLSQPFKTIALNIIKRIIPVFFIWSLFYVLVVSKRIIWLTDPHYWLQWLVNGGPGVQLWFLPALAINMIITAYLRPRYNWRTLIIGVTLLYCIGLGLGAYLPLFYANPDPIWFVITRDTPFFGLLFVLSGLYFAEHGALNLRVSWFLFIIGAFLQLFEAVYLDTHQIMAFNTTNTLIGTIPFAIGAFGIALHFNTQQKWVAFLAKFGRCSLGIYAIHMFFILIAINYMNPVNLWQRLAICFFVLIFSTYVAYTMSLIKPLRFLVQ